MNGNLKDNYRNETPNPAEIILFQNRRHTTSLFKLLLTILEEIKDDGVISEEYFFNTRKYILDTGNGNLREFEDLLNKFEIRHKRRI